MITPLSNLPPNMVGFVASHEVTKDDFVKVVIPAVKKIVAATGELNYLLVIDTPLRNFTFGAWWQDALLGLRNLGKWRRAAIVSDSGAVNRFTDIFSLVVPGQFKGFRPEQLQAAIRWVSRHA